MKQETISQKELVPIVREILKSGLSEQFMKSCVRIGELDPLGGGLKASFVGRLPVDVHMVVKIGDEELKTHKKLMEYVNANVPRTFPQILSLAPLGDGRFALLMEQLRKFSSLLDKIYKEKIPAAHLKTIIDLTLQKISAIHQITIETRTRKFLPETLNPYFPRIESKLKEILRVDSSLQSLLSRQGSINGRETPSLTTIFTSLKKRLDKDLRATTPVIVHGDPHLLNALVRRRGTYGFSCLFIDPNPTIGISDRLYDYGKLLHWVEEVGWVRVRPTICQSTWNDAGKQNRWSLTTSLQVHSRAAEARRIFVENYVHEKIEKLFANGDGSLRMRLHVSTASAHLGFAAITAQEKGNLAHRFIVAKAIEHLVSAYEMCAQSPR